ncbi:MAG: hypothetical protein ABJH68_10545 [Ilumatobacter sp.]|uniref:hypothetical protein n=1 Tax=Ilumatobacter sp. TaxID=1967498 RepID=UPI003299871F
MSRARDPLQAGTMQRAVDELLAVSRQRWVLGIGAVATATTAFAAASVASGGWWLPGLVVVIASAIVSAARPDDHTGLVVVGLVIWQWLARVDDVGTPWLPVAACCMLVFHALLALTAVVPTSGSIPGATIARWTERTAVVAASTVAMWIVVVVLERRDLPGNGALTGLALLIVAATATAIRARSVRSPLR